MNKLKKKKKVNAIQKSWPNVRKKISNQFSKNKKSKADDKIKKRKGFQEK